MDINEIGPNSWLLSNSTLYIANRFLNIGDDLNAYSLFDLSKLSEAILFSEKIITISSPMVESSEAFKSLKSIIKVLDINDNEKSAIIQGIADDSSTSDSGNRC